VTLLGIRQTKWKLLKKKKKKTEKGYIKKTPRALLLYSDNLESDFELLKSCMLIFWNILAALTFI